MTVSRRLVSALVLFCPLSIAIMASDAHAQTSGVKAGVQWSMLLEDGQAPAGATRRPGVFGGVFYTFSDALVTAQVEGLAGRQTVRFESGGAPYTVDLTYFSIPLLVRVNAARFEHGRVYVAGGVSVDSRFRARRVTGGDRVDIASDFEPWDVRWLVSGGVQAGRIVVDARYSRGLRNVATAATGPDITNQVFGVSLGYGF